MTAKNEELAWEIVTGCTETDTDTSYSFALTCDDKYLADKITAALNQKDLDHQAEIEKPKADLNEVATTYGMNNDRQDCPACGESFSYSHLAKAFLSGIVWFKNNV